MCESDTETASVSEKVQHKIGRDLHDGLGQSLTGIACMATALATDLTKRNTPEAKRAQEIACMVQEAREQLRRLAHGLIPVHFGHRELPVMLQSLARDSQRLFGIHCETKCLASTLPMLPEAVLHLYRIAQGSD